MTLSMLAIKDKFLKKVFCCTEGYKLVTLITLNYLSKATKSLRLVREDNIKRGKSTIGNSFSET